MESIGIVDDNPTALKQMHLLLEKAGFRNIQSYTDPQQALQAFSVAPPSVLLIDFMMPGLDGVELLGRLRQSGAMRRTPVAMVSGCADMEAMRLSAYQAGAHEVISKPLRPLEFALMVRNLARLSEVAAPNSSETDFRPLNVPRVKGASAPAVAAALHEQVLHRLLEKVASYRDESRGNQNARMARYAAIIARHHGLQPEQQQQLLAAAPLHDIGKIGVPDSVLFKRGDLTPSERAQLERHTTIGFELLRDESSTLLQLGAEIALSHHERWDGTGYPLGLSGLDIPLSGRIVAVADAFDSLTSLRMFKPPWVIDRAVNAIKHESGRRFDPQVVTSFMAALDSLKQTKRHFDSCPGLEAVSSAR